MGLKEFFRPTKLKLIIFFILVVFEIIMQFFSPESTWIVSRVLHFIEGILIIPITPFIIMFGLSISLVIVILIYFYLISSIVCYIRNKIKNKGTAKKTEGPGSWTKFKEFIRFKWLKVLLFFVFLTPLSALITPLVSGFFLAISLILIEPIRAFFPAFKMGGGTFFMMFSSLPFLLTLFCVYLVACFIYKIHKKTNSKRVLYMILGIGIVLSLIILVPLGIMFSNTFTPYTVTKDSPAPGCVEAKGYRGMGGLECYGKNIIKDIKVEPPMDCIDVGANNCDGGVLSVTNYCEGLEIGGLKLSHEGLVSFEKSFRIKLIKDENNNTLVKNFHTKIDDESFNHPVISTTGKLGDKKFTLNMKHGGLVVDPSSECVYSIDGLKLKCFDCIDFDVSPSFYGNEGVIVIENSCEEEVSIGGMKIDKFIPQVNEPGGTNIIEFVKDESNNMIAIRTRIHRAYFRDGYKPYLPLEDETMSMQGSYNNETFTVSYVKTKKLCD